MSRIKNIAKSGPWRIIQIALTVTLMLYGTIAANAQTYQIQDTSFRNHLRSLYGDSLIDAFGNLDTIAATNIAGTLDCSNRNIKDLSGIQYFTNINRILCRNNRIMHIPDLTGINDVLVEFDCSNNRLPSLPSFRTPNNSLKSIKCSNNQITALPNLNQMSGLDTLRCENNYLTFGDLLSVPQASLPSFVYYPQKPFEIASRVELLEGDTYTLRFPEDTVIGANMSRVFKNNIVLANIGQAKIFTIQNVKTSDAGIYTFVVNNNQLPFLTLTTSPQELVIVNKNPKVFTPDGDNQNDVYYISCDGLTRIFNKTGTLVKELQGQSQWDGTDTNGNMLPSGTYILTCGEQSESHVTIVR